MIQINKDFPYSLNALVKIIKIINALPKKCRTRIWNVVSDDQLLYAKLKDYG